MSETNDPTPTTEAGREALKHAPSERALRMRYNVHGVGMSWRDRILAIEAQARAEALDALRETTIAFHTINWHDRRVFGHDGWSFDNCPVERCAANRAILATKADR